jgi:hypothetical protein
LGESTALEKPRVVAPQDIRRAFLTFVGVGGIGEFSASPARNSAAFASRADCASSSSKFTILIFVGF